MAYTREQFIKKVGPMAQENAKVSKILASLIIAQAILESNNGNSGLTTQGNALFGIKANTSWRGKVWTGSTIEYYDGKRTNIVAGFRAYDSWKESIADHSKLLTSLPRYKAVVDESDYIKACKAIQAAGYATDPQYANKLIQLIEANKLTQYDSAPQETIDQQLYDAISKIIKSGIIIELDSWKHTDVMKLSDVPYLLPKLGGIEKLVQQGVISERAIWDEKKYTKDNVRSLLIKYAAKLTQYDREPKEAIDQPLYDAVSKIIKAGIIIELDSWKHIDVIKLSNVPYLLPKLGGIEKLVQQGVISQRVIWDEKKYTKDNVRSLLIKYAVKLG